MIFGIPTFVILGIFVVVGIFLVMMFVNNARKMFVALIFDIVGAVSFIIVLAPINEMMFVLGYLIVAAAIAMMLLLDKKYVPWLSWIMALGMIIYNSFLGVGEVLDIFYIINSSRVFGVICVYLSLATELGLMITAAVLRKKRHAKRSSIAESSDSGHNLTGFVECIDRNWCAVVATVLSVISYVFTLLGLRYITSLEVLFGGDDTTMMIIMFAVALVSGGIAWVMYRIAITYGYDGGAFDNALYIWSWVPIIIIILILIAIALVMSTVSDSSFSSVANKRIYKVVDENNEVRVLKYNADSGETTCLDDLGNVWETFDNGKHFRQRDVRVIKHDDGTKTVLHDVSGGTGSLFREGLDLYSFDDGGKTVTKIGDE